jgi:hypothetical protein
MWSPAPLITHALTHLLFHFMSIMLFGTCSTQLLCIPSRANSLGFPKYLYIIDICSNSGIDTDLVNSSSKCLLADSIDTMAYVFSCLISHYSSISTAPSTSTSSIMTTNICILYRPLLQGLGMWYFLFLSSFIYVPWCKSLVFTPYNFVFLCNYLSWLINVALSVILPI